jgi:AcrR family transcriptional regulator
MPRVKTNIKKEKLVRAAVEVFGRKGLTNATVPEIAKKAGIATGTFYLYFRDKEDIFIDALNFVSRHLREYLEDAYIKTLGKYSDKNLNYKNIYTVVYAIYSAFFDFVDRYRREFLIIFREGVSHQVNFYDEMRRIIEQIVEDTNTRIKMGLQLNTIRKMNEGEMAAVSWAIVGSLSMSAQAYMDGYFKRRELISSLVNFTLNGIKKEL